MQSYIYVDIDDEITTVIGKLKANQEGREVFLVVPKRALIAQSLVNLQLLDKEAKKIAKKLIFVSPDAHTRKTAEKAGLEVKKYVAKPEEPLKQENSQQVVVPRKLSPAEEEAAKEELNLLMGKSLPKQEKGPKPIPGFSLKPTTFVAGSSFAPPRPIINQPAKPLASPVLAPPALLNKKIIDPLIQNQLQVENSQPKSEAEEIKKPKHPVIDLRKKSKNEDPKLSLTSQTTKSTVDQKLEENPFKVRSILSKEEGAVAPLLPSSGEASRQQQPAQFLEKKQNLSNPVVDFRSQTKELANLTLKEKERLRDLWMENKGVVRGKFVKKQGNIDLKKEEQKKISTSSSFEQNDSVIKTTRRIVSGTGKIVDLRVKKNSLTGDPTVAGLKKKDQREIVLPVINVRFFSFFILIILAVLLIIGGIVLPKADVSVTSKNLASDFELGFKVSGETAEINLAEKILPGSPVRFKLTQENIFSASGEKEVKEKSRGQVTFYNTGASAIEVKKNTIITGDKGRKYFTLSPISVPAASTPVATETADNSNDNASVESQSGEASVEIVAGDFGPEYDLKNGSTVEIEEGFDNVSAKITRSLTGGKVEKVKVVTEEDINKAKEELTAKIREKSAEEAKKYFDFQKGEILFPSESGLEEISFSSSKNKDDIGENFSAKIEGSFFALTFSSSDAERMAEQEVAGEDQNKKGEISIVNFKVVNFNPLENQMEISGNFQHKEKADPKSEELRSYLVAKSRKEGEDFLSRNSDIEKFEIRIFPGWLPWFPLLEKNIEIKID